MPRYSLKIMEKSKPECLSMRLKNTVNLWLTMVKLEISFIIFKSKNIDEIWFLDISHFFSNNFRVLILKLIHILLQSLSQK